MITERLLNALATSDFRSGCIGALFARIPDAEADIGPTLMVILTALIVEYLPLSPLSPTALLRGLGSWVGSYGGAYLYPSPQELNILMTWHGVMTVWGLRSISAGCLFDMHDSPRGGLREGSV